MAGGFLSLRSWTRVFDSHEISSFAFDFRTSTPCKETEYPEASEKI